MGTTTNIQAWSTTPASNANSDSAIAIPEGCDPGNINDAIRAVMAAIAKFADDTGGALVAGGTSTALTVTTGQALSSGHIDNGLRLTVRTASSATGAATIAIDGLSAIAIKKNDGSAVASGDWASGQILDLVYSSAAVAFLLANIGNVTNLSISALTEDTSPEHAADFVPTYDNSAGTNKKVLPKNLFPSKQASFSASKSGDQSVGFGETVVTFDSETFDNGSYFASNAWTPPAGNVLVNASVLITNLTGGLSPGEGVYLILKRGGSNVAFARFVNTDSTSASFSTLSLTWLGTASGAQAFQVYVSDDADIAYTVSANPGTFFQGTMI